MSRRLLVPVAVAAGALLLAGCGGSRKPRPDLVFVSSRSGDYAIYAMNADGSRQRRLTREGSGASAFVLFFQIDPAWSADGRSIAFASGRDGRSHIYVMRADGTGTRRLTNSAKDDDHPSWAPDGRRIVFGREGALYAVPAGGGPAHRVGRGFGNAADPAWSPDGKLIAYDYREPGFSIREVWIMRADGGGKRRLTKLGQVSELPAWSPDGKRIAFQSNIRLGRFEIYTIGVDGKGSRRLTRSTSDDIEPAWSPDGKVIAFSRDGSIVTVDAAGNEKKLTNGKNNDSSPAWKPGARS